MPNRKRRVKELHPAAAETRKKRAIPVVDEERTLGRRQVKTRSVRVEKQVLQHEETVDVPVALQTVYIPAVEEKLVITKRLSLKEEIHFVRWTVWPG